MKSMFRYSLIAVWMMAASCLGDLDVKPTNIKDQTVAFNSVDDVNAGVLGAYASLNGQSIKISSLIADENMMPLENTTNAGATVFRWQHNESTPDVLPVWQSNYQAIDRANRILAVIDGVPAEAHEVEQRNQMKGELLALRAYCHLELLRNYAVSYDGNDDGVPVMTTSQVSQPGRSKVSAVFAQIRKDLADAKLLIPANWASSTRITRLAVFAIEARTALYQQDWTAAIAAADEVIGAVPLATEQQFPGIWTDLATHEVIWKLKREPSDERFGAFYRSSAGMVLYAPSFKLLAAFDAAHDVRFSSWIADLDAAPASTRWTVTKYTGNSANLNLTDIKLFRVSEMYLIRAEAQARKTGANIAAANTDLETLRTSRIDNYVHSSYGTAAQVLAAVEAERFRELAFEGHRYYDLRRWKKDIVRLPQDIVSVGGNVLTLPVTKKQYFMPIPFEEMQANRNIGQHPLYQ
ncbi:RagB/SusD family nutrient uptake outer membrane protein [Chitinophaga caseinilytica]|uniref:RagB/SusD family nutrient uptake outer membrane protein n=1 Tax=Chitinophaga caseinilytica TaxID=2267521 RepID=A0ABZ2Z7C1_9BACT